MQSPAVMPGRDDVTVVPMVGLAPACGLAWDVVRVSRERQRRKVVPASHPGGA